MHMYGCIHNGVGAGNCYTMLKQAAIGSRLNPQTPKRGPSPPWFEGWYTRVVSPQHSFGIVTGYFPDQTPKNAAAYTGLLYNHDKNSASKLRTFESYLPVADGLSISRGEAAQPNLLGASEAADFCFEDKQRRIIKIAADENDNLLYEAAVGGASLKIKSISESLPWSDAGAGSPQGLLHLLPGVGLHWYVHSTKTRVEYELWLPPGTDNPAASSGASNSNSSSSSSNSNSSRSSRSSHCGSGGGADWNGNGSRAGSSAAAVAVAAAAGQLIRGEGWAHVEKNWGGSFPRSFIWSQGYATTGGTADFNTEAEFCLAGGVLPTFNIDKLPLPLPNMLLLGYRSKHRTWHFKPQSPTLFTTKSHPEQGSLVVTAQQLNKTLILRVEAGLGTFSTVGGPTRGGFVPHSVESYSAKATAECYEWGKLVEVTHFDRSALEFGGSYACAWAEGAGVGSSGLVCNPQWE